MSRITLHAVFSACVAACVLPACSPVRGFCSAAAECDDLEAGFFDFVGESNDSDEVCVAQNEGLLRALRANEEEDCFEEARLQEEWMACVADTFANDPDDACDGFVVDQDRNPCFGELDDLDDQRADNDNDCNANEE